MNGRRRKLPPVAWGCIIVAVVGVCWASVLAGGHWWEEGREIRLCQAVKDYYDEHGRAPESLSELPAPYSEWTETRDGSPYDYRCFDRGGVPDCGLLWQEVRDGQKAQVSRGCGPLDERRWSDWF